MTAVNTAVHELAGVRLPLQPYAGGHAVFMYSTAADGNVTLQLKEPDDLDRGSLAAMLARLQDDATFSISYQDTDILSDGSIDVLLGGGGSNNSLQTAEGNEAVTATFDLFDSSSGPDLTLSPQTFTNSAEAFINDNSNSLGVPADNDPVSSTDDGKKMTQTEVVKLAVKRARPKAASPNRQGPQQCQVCAKVFGNASALAKHKLTHSDERKYVCTMCGKAFKRQDHLNGHMLTHRNKKPYECKAEGCGKSYCDARSLRRHTENHHSAPAMSTTSTSTTTASSSSAVNASTTTMSPAQGAASGDAASPHGSSCIQYAPPPTTTGGKSQLQQLLASEPAKSTTGGNNDGLTKQQLDLIHQIMEQTQRQSASALKATSKQTLKPVTKAPIKVQRVWSSQQNSANKTNGNSSNPSTKATSNNTASANGVSNTNAASANASNNNSKCEPKPVECNLCHRKFKNIPALNGHMRLHGGYFKKDADNKKCEKKDTSGPPLQTASISVRALIEEKIINKRITNTPTTTLAASVTTTSHANAEAHTTSAPPLFPLTVHSTTSNSELDASKISSFVVPAPPATEKRRHSDAESFTVPRTLSGTNSTQQEAEALADLILKRDKASIKRTISDPGQQQSQSQIIQFQTGSDSFTLSYQAEDGSDYLSPSLQDEVFNQVPDSMLLQGVDAQQLATIQFQTDSLLQDQGDHPLLDDYTNLQDSVVESPSYQSSHSVNQELQAVLDSPLPESLAEFSTYHSTGNLDLPSPSYQTQSPVQYSSHSPHATIATHSPLQSPLIRHDSPGFAYPTPPASHEGLSPCFGQNSILPMVSPKQNDFNQIVARDLDDPAQPSSPLTAAFFTSTMSSSAAVEEALEEVLPGESIAADELYPSLTNSPPPPATAPSPLAVGLTPVASPLSTVPASTTPTSSTHSGTYTPNTVSFPMSPHFTLQSQMLPNSEDPLLSSSPKDFVPRKKFEFNGIPLKVVSSNGLLDLHNANLTGILVESNGEIKFIQTGGAGFQPKNILVTGAPVLAAQQPQLHQIAIKEEVVGGHAKHLLVQKIAKSKSYALKSRDIKQEDVAQDVFLSPTTVPASPVRVSRKRPRAEPLQLPILHQSRLRATRSKPHRAAAYTPPPILNPNRSGSGLYYYFKQKSSEQEDASTAWCNESVPESDSTPHINVGAQFQCTIPSFAPPAYSRVTQERAPEDLLWDPGITQCSDGEVDMYLDFACCAAVPGGGRNQEYAMHLLHMCGGNIHDAMLKLMQPTPMLPSEHPLLCYQYAESDKWTASETELFHQALHKHDKDFGLISQEIGSKTVKQCVQFYYMWKKVCTDEYRRLKQNRERRNGLKSADFDEEKPYPDAKLLGIADTGSPMPLHEHRNFICEFSDCSASFNSRAALNGHIRIHGGTATRNSPPPPHPNHIQHNHADAQHLGGSALAGAVGTTSTTHHHQHHHHHLVSKRSANLVNGTHQSMQIQCHAADVSEDYPCKICGKVFTKIKSRSAHMKSHRPPDADAISRQRQQHKDKELLLNAHSSITNSPKSSTCSTQTFDSVPTLSYSS